MTVEATIAGIIAKAEEVGLNRQQVSDRSRVPKSTVDNIFSGRTTNPTLQTILDLAEAVGYTIEKSEVPLPDGVDRQTMAQIISMYERQIAAQERQFNLVTAEKNRWIKLLVIIIGILITCILFILIYDITHPEVGWFQR